MDGVIRRQVEQASRTDTAEIAEHIAALQRLDDRAAVDEATGCHLLSKSALERIDAETGAETIETKPAYRDIVQKQFFAILQLSVQAQGCATSISTAWARLR